MKELCAAIAACDIAALRNFHGFGVAPTDEQADEMLEALGRALSVVGSDQLIASFFPASTIPPASPVRLPIVSPDSEFDPSTLLNCVIPSTAHTLLGTAALVDNVPALLLLIAAGSDIRAGRWDTKQDQWCPVLMCTRNSEVVALLRCLNPKLLNLPVQVTAAAAAANAVPMLHVCSQGIGVRHFDAAITADGETLLHVAARTGAEQAVQYMLASGANPTVTAANAKWEWPDECIPSGHTVSPVRGPKPVDGTEHPGIRVLLRSSSRPPMPSFQPLVASIGGGQGAGPGVDRVGFLLRFGRFRIFKQRFVMLEACGVRTRFTWYKNPLDVRPLGVFLLRGASVEPTTAKRGPDGQKCGFLVRLAKGMYPPGDPAVNYFMADDIASQQSWLASFQRAIDHANACATNGITEEPPVLGSGTALLTSVQLWQNACRVIILIVFPGEVHPDDVSVDFPGAHEMVLKLRDRVVMGGRLFGEIMPALSRVTFLEAGARLKIELEKDSTWHWPSLFHDQAAATSTVFHDLDDAEPVASASATGSRVAEDGDVNSGSDESSDDGETPVEPLIDLGIGGTPVRAKKSADPRRKSWAPSNTSPAKPASAAAATPKSPRKPQPSPATLAPPPAASSGSRLRRKTLSPTLPSGTASSGRRAGRPKSMAIQTPVDPDDTTDEFEEFVRERSNSAATRPSLVTFSAMSLGERNPFV